MKMLWEGHGFRRAAQLAKTEALAAEGPRFVRHKYYVGGSFVDMQGALPSRGDGPGALLMAAFFLSFGLFAILRPDKLRTAMDNFANAWKQDSWHPYRMPLPVLRLVVGGAGIGGAALFAYIAYVALSR